MLFFSNTRSLPLLGVQGAGKTYFLFSLGYLVSHRGWGHVENQKGEEAYLDQLLPYVSRGDPFPPTMKNHPVKIKVDSLPDKYTDGSISFTISSEDFSGGEFENAMESTLTKRSDDNGPRAEFIDLYQDCDGLIVVVDIVRDASKDDFQADREQRILDALAGQVEPLVTGINTAMNANQGLDGKPIFFIFTKQDIHGLKITDISEYFDRLMAMPLQRLKAHDCPIRKFTTSAVGWTDGDVDQQLDDLEYRGYADILQAMARLFD